MEYTNLVIDIGDPVDGRFAVKVHSDTMGEAGGVLSLAPESPEIVAAQQRLVPGTPDRDALIAFGGVLFDALFAGEVCDLYRESYGRVRGDDETGLRLRLCIGPPALAALPWELTYDRHRDCFLATSVETPLTRYINLHEPIEQLTTSPPVKVLVAIPDRSGLDVATERAIITDALSELGGTVKITVLDGEVTRTAISEALVKERYNVLHFIGHGRFQNEDGYLLLNSDQRPGAEDLIEARTFGYFFRDYPWMKLIVLNSCQGAAVATTRPLAGVAPQLVRAGIPAVVAMQYPVTDAAAVLFAREFYLNLCTGPSRGRVDTAVSHARNRLQMDFADTLAFATPVLYMRSPSGVVFDLDSAGEQKDLRLQREDVQRLKAIKEAREHNVAALQGSGGGSAEKLGLLENEGKQIAEIDHRLRRFNYTVAGVIAASWIVLFASWVGLFNVLTLDDWLERHLFAYMDGFVDAPLDPRMLLVRASLNGAENGTLGVPELSWRCHHADLVSGLAAAGAQTVAFDLYFEDPSDCDQQFADAIRRAAAAGTPVVLGAREYTMEGGRAKPVMAPALADAVKDDWGILDAQPYERRVRMAARLLERAPAAIEEREAAVIPSFALRTAMRSASRHAGAGTLVASLDPRHDTLSVRDANGKTVTAVPLADDRLNMIVAVTDDYDRKTSAYHDVLAGARVPARLGRFKDRIVIVGYASPDDRWDISPGNTRYGMELQASAISNVLLNRYIHPARPLVQYVVIVLMGAIGALMQMRAVTRRQLSFRLKPPWMSSSIDLPVPLIIVLAAYGLIVFLAYKQYRVIFDVNYHVVSLLLMYGMVGWARKGMPLTRTTANA